MKSILISVSFLLLFCTSVLADTAAGIRNPACQNADGYRCGSRKGKT